MSIYAIHQMGEIWIMVDGKAAVKLTPEAAVDFANQILNEAGKTHE